MGSLGIPEMLVIGIVALLVFGPKKLPEIGAGLGKAIRDFKAAMNETTSQIKEQIEQSTTQSKPTTPTPEDRKVEHPPESTTTH